MSRYFVGLKDLRQKRAQKAILEAAKEIKNLMLYREMNNKIMAQTTQKETEKYPETTADTIAPYTSHADAQYMARIVQDVVELITLSEYAGAQTEWCQEILADRSVEQFMICTRMLKSRKCQQRVLVLQY